MIKTDAKKALYKQKPKAILVFDSEIDFYFKAILEDGTTIYFIVPMNESTKHYAEGMEAQLLIPWMDTMSWADEKLDYDRTKIRFRPFRRRNKQPH